MAAVPTVLEVQSMHAPSPTAGWRAALQLVFAQREGRTYLRECSHQGPLLVQRPFYPAANECHVYLLHPPAGVVGGDHLSINVHLEADTQALLTTPAATKFYRSDGRIAHLQQQLEVGSGAALEWLPQETLYFDGARAQCRTQVHLQAQARFLGWEIACFGQPCANQAFLHGSLQVAWSVDGEQARLRERQRLDAHALQAVWGLRGLNSLGTLYAYPADNQLLEQVRSVLGESRDSGCTLLDGLLIVRALHQETPALRQQLESVWRSLRPAVVGRTPLPPRIWAT